MSHENKLFYFEYWTSIKHICRVSDAELFHFPDVLGGLLQYGFIETIGKLFDSSGTLWCSPGQQW